ANSSAGVGTVNEPAVRNGVKARQWLLRRSSFALSGIGGVMLRDLPQGTYQFQVRAVTSQGHGSWSPVASTEVSGRATTEMATILGLAGAMAVLLTCVLLGWLACRQRGIAEDCGHREPRLLELHVCAGRVTYSESDILGTGSFGRVYRGLVRSLSTPGGALPAQPGGRAVAVKNVNEKATMRANGTMLMELMENGDLKTCLRQMRPDSDDPISRPMYDRNPAGAVVRPDLRRHVLPGDEEVCAQGPGGRNCMVTADYCHFGMTGMSTTRTITKRRARRLCQSAGWRRSPYATVCFTTATDVWSYGVVLWEIATLAHQPFNSRSNEEVVNMVKSGKTLQPPEDCPAFLSELMAPLLGSEAAIPSQLPRHPNHA
uniref:Pkinase_Tyr domain-containing protein n=1 Tax=Macrostomum lignano TaxID=282301 RepID=A0A1I8JRH8_9PLAT